MFDILFALNGQPDVVVLLKIDEGFESVAFGETIDCSVAVFINAANKVVGHSHIKSAVRPICEQIDKAASHAVIVEDVDGRDKPGHDESDAAA